MRQERIQKVRPKKIRPSDIEDLAVEEADADLLTDVDELLDEIDAVLEDQSVLANFRQRSGQ
jgi:hypothetical protein